MGENETGIEQQSEIKLIIAKEKLVPNQYNKTILLVSIIASIFFLSIMVMTKLWPCFEVSWSQDFCNRWNDFWFSLSASIIAAIIFFVIFTLVPYYAKRKEIEPLISYDIISIPVHINLMIIVATGIDINRHLKLSSFQEAFNNIDWVKFYPYVFEGMKKKPFLYCLLEKLDYAKKKLEEIDSQYNQYLNSEEREDLKQGLIHHKFFERAVFLRRFLEASDDLDEEEKKCAIYLFYDFYIRLVAFACRFRVIRGFTSYGL